MQEDDAHKVWEASDAINKQDCWTERSVPHLSRWIQTYVTKPARMHTTFALGDTVSKQVWTRQWREQPLWLEPRSMERPSAHKVIHAEAFKEVCKALNKVHNVQ